MVEAGSRGYGTKKLGQGGLAAVNMAHEADINIHRHRLAQCHPERSLTAHYIYYLDNKCYILKVYEIIYHETLSDKLVVVGGMATSRKCYPIARIITYHSRTLNAS